MNWVEVRPGTVLDADSVIAAKHGHRVSSNGTVVGKPYVAIYFMGRDEPITIDCETEEDAIRFCRALVPARQAEQTRHGDPL